MFDSTVFAPSVFEAQWDYRAADGDGADGTNFSYYLLSPGGNDVEFYELAGAALVVSFKEYLSHKWLSLRNNGTQWRGSFYLTDVRRQRIEWAVGGDTGYRSRAIKYTRNTLFR